MIKIRQDIHVWYQVSCGHTVRRILDRIQNTGLCPYCPLNENSQRVFIIATTYVKPLDDD